MIGKLSQIAIGKIHVSSCKFYKYSIYKYSGWWFQPTPLKNMTDSQLGL
jgi:hypothetical protein